MVAAQTGNVAYPQYPKFEDFGDMIMTGNGGTGYVRVDWFTPDGLDTWGDGRLFILGTEGYIELRKYTNVATGLKGGNHLYIVDKKQARYIDCNKVPLPFGPQFVRDVVERTDVAQNQEQALLAAELVLEAQKIATRPSRRLTDEGTHEDCFARRWPRRCSQSARGARRRIGRAALRALPRLGHLRARRNRGLERHAAVELAGGRPT